MRVAIIGAGPGGLACALELERHGIYPDIFERSGRVGLAAPNVGVLLQMFHRPQKDQLKYLHNNFGIKITPLARLSRVKIISPRRTASVSGNLGYLVERGQGEKSIEVQLAGKIRSGINFDIHANYAELAGQYDFVVVASGSVDAAREMKIYNTVINARVRAAVISGRFDPGEALVFYNLEFARHGYAYLAPFSRQRAVLLLSVPDIKDDEMDDYWNTLLERKKTIPEIIETFEMTHVSGITARQRIGNIFLVGNSGGFTDSFIGLGLVWGMASGVLAGMAIAGGLDYELMAKPLIEKIKRLKNFREAFNTLGNGDLDRIVGIVGLPGVKHVVYNTNIDIIRLLHPFLKKYGRRQGACGARQS